MLSPGQLVDGKYRIVELLGEGGMGLVYVAEHERLARRVALKVVRTVSSAEVLERFKRESRALARVNSPHVAEALDADVLADGTPYLVMELLEGRDLRMELRQRGPLPIEEAVAYVVQSCRGVAAAHRAGIVHRDLKPHNLFLTRSGDVRRVKVVDFGIAKFLDGEDGALTNSLLAVGTPLYMSPEHIREPRSVSTPADVWALGVILYELLAGFSPFADASTGAIVAAITLDDPAFLRRARPDVPEALAKIVHSALLKDRAQRMPSAEAFAQTLKPYACPDDALTVTESTFRVGPMVELPRPLPRHLASEVRREIERHVEDAQAGDSTVSYPVPRAQPPSDRVPGEDTAKVPSLGMISARPPPPSHPGAGRRSVRPRSIAPVPRRQRVLVAACVALAVLCAGLAGYALKPAPTALSALPTPRAATAPGATAVTLDPEPVPAAPMQSPARTAAHKPSRAPQPAASATPPTADGNPVHL